MAHRARLQLKIVGFLHSSEKKVVFSLQNKNYILLLHRQKRQWHWAMV